MRNTNLGRICRATAVFLSPGGIARAMVGCMIRIRLVVVLAGVDYASRQILRLANKFDNVEPLKLPDNEAGFGYHLG